MKVLFCVLLTLMTAGAAKAQAPHEDWRTIETTTFRIHYPAPWEDWAALAASRLESARERVATAVGYDPTDRIEVIIMDPAATANGSALPLLGSPRIILWTTPPAPGSVIGDNRDWQETLIVHETAHILHINRPSRNRLNAVLERLLPVGPIAFAPRWVSEGYATVIEGDLTGSGRPFRDFRAVVLRTWGETGRLPTYSQMASDRSSFMGMSMAYLVGSAYLEWLRDRTGPDSLQNLWRRMTAREDRGFAEAFRGVFGDSPESLYALFRAEITQKSRNLNDAIAPQERSGELVLDLSRRAGPIDVWPDGQRLVGVIRPRDLPPQLTVWSTAIDEEAAEAREQELARVLERDPDDVRPVDPPAAPRKRLHRHQLPAGADVESLSVLDGDHVLFTSSHPDDDGVLHSELHVWTLSTGHIRRITHGGDIFSVSAAPGHPYAYGIRHRHGKSARVRLDVASGEITELTPMVTEPLFGSISVSDQGALAWVESDARGPHITILFPDGVRTRAVPAAPDRLVADLQWEPGSRSLLATLGFGGYLEVARLDAESGQWVDLTRSTRGSWSPAAGGDSVYFLSMDPNGLDVRRIDADVEPLDPATRVIDQRFAPAVRREFIGEAPPLEIAEVTPAEPYGIGPREHSSLFGGYATSDARLLEAGLRSGDPVGRLEAMLIGGWSDEDERGVLLDARWRGTKLPVEISAWHWRQNESTPDFTGASLGTQRTWRAIERRLRVSGAAGWEQSDPGQIEDSSGAGGFGELDAVLRRQYGSVRLSGAVAARFESLQSEDSQRGRSSGLLGASLGGTAVTYSDAIGEASNGEFHLGGLASSILPPFRRGAFVASPGLAPARLVGDEFRQQRVTFELPFLPGQFFGERSHVRSHHESDTVSLVGWNVRFLTGEVRMLGLPSLDLNLGVARELDENRPHDYSWWIGTRWTLD